MKDKIEYLETVRNLIFNEIDALLKVYNKINKEITLKKLLVKIKGDSTKNETNTK